MFSDLGERKTNFYDRKIEYPTDISRKIFVKEVSKGYKETKDEEKLINLHGFKMKDRNDIEKRGDFQTYYSYKKTCIISSEVPGVGSKRLIKKFGIVKDKREIKYENSKINILN